MRWYSAASVILIHTIFKREIHNNLDIFEIFPCGIVLNKMPGPLDILISQVSLFFEGIGVVFSLKILSNGRRLTLFKRTIMFVCLADKEKMSKSLKWKPKKTFDQLLHRTRNKTNPFVENVHLNDINYLFKTMINS